MPTKKINNENIELDFLHNTLEINALLDSEPSENGRTCSRHSLLEYKMPIKGIFSLYP